MELLYYPDEFLTKKLDDFNFEKPQVDIAEAKKEMLDIMFAQDGVGLSAQVGINAQMFVMGSKHFDKDPFHQSKSNTSQRRNNS